MNFRQEETIGPRYAAVTNYSDVPPCFELIAVYDDALKKDDYFTAYAVRVAQEILGTRAKATWGKWGARLETGAANPGKSLDDLAPLASEVVAHPAWLGLLLSTHVFSYGSAGATRGE